MRLEETTAKRFIARKMTLSVAESCTGGLLSHCLTNIPGSSAFFLMGIIAYDNAAKTKILKVPQQIFTQHGAVSAEAALFMAQGVRGILNTDIGIAITGIAGPTGGNKHKPVGTVYIALRAKDSSLVAHHLFQGSRSQIKSLAKNAALRMLLKVVA